MRARPREFEQLLANLIANGVKFVAPGVEPVVRVTAVREGAGWRFEVADNGIGIPPPHAQRIFGMFARAPAGEEYPGHRDRARDRPEGRRGRGRADLGRAARRRR